MTLISRILKCRCPRLLYFLDFHGDCECFLPIWLVVYFQACMNLRPRVVENNCRGRSIANQVSVLYSAISSSDVRFWIESRKCC
uniref:Uncharacterized protein n=1 Tax=Zea mays TaxID=4577 RepID=B4FE71_MAIZE|nr:unknown [Zea mays]